MFCQNSIAIQCRWDGCVLLRRKDHVHSVLWEINVLKDTFGDGWMRGGGYIIAKSLKIDFHLAKCRYIKGFPPAHIGIDLVLRKHK